MDKKLKLETMCKISWENLCTAEEVFGVSSVEAAMFRAEWAAFNEAYQLLFEDEIEP